MGRTTEYRFGRCGALRTTPVHKDGWWFALVDDVALDADHRTDNALPSREIEELMPRISIALGLSNPGVARPVNIGMVAIRVESGSSVAYPFLLAEHDGRARLIFSSSGPDDDIKVGIANALWQRFVFRMQGDQ